MKDKIGAKAKFVFKKKTRSNFGRAIKFDVVKALLELCLKKLTKKLTIKLY